MSQISKQALIVDNNQSFPTNNAGEITPSDLRAFNVNMIDSLVNEIPYQSFTASVTNSINLLNAFTSSQQPSFIALNSFTASQLVINTGYNAATSSLNNSVSVLQSQTSQLTAFTGSINQIQSAGITLGNATRFNFSGLITASITTNVNGNIADISLGSDTTRVSTASFNAYTASTNSSISNLNQFSASTLIRLTNIESTTASLNSSVSNLNAFTSSQNNFNNSATASISQLLSLSASLSGGYATQGELDASSSQLQNNIDTKLNTSSFNAYTASSNASLSALNTFSASQLLLNPTFATTGSNVFSGSQTFTGSIYNSIISASIVATTASLDFSKANFFTLTLPGNSNTFINIQNVGIGQTALLEISNAGLAATASFNTNVYQPSASFYVPTNISGSNDILTFSTFNGNKIYLASVKTMVNS
jgi:hypothetical protein